MTLPEYKPDGSCDGKLVFFGFAVRMWDFIVLVPNPYLSCYFILHDCILRSAETLPHNSGISCDYTGT